MNLTLREYLTFLADNEINVRANGAVGIYTEKHILESCDDLIIKNNGKYIIDKKHIEHCRCFINDQWNDYLVVAVIVFHTNLHIKVEPKPKNEPESKYLEIVGIL